MITRNEFIRNNTFDFFDEQKDLELFAKENNVPIISKESLDFLIAVIKITKPKKIIELGTAIGYSAICMALQYDDIEVISFERNVEMYNLAIQNIEKLGLTNRIRVYNIDITDAKEIIDKEKYDLAFIDAAKGQYRVFFDLIFECINSGGTIISDNLFSKDIVLESNIENIPQKNRTIYKRNPGARVPGSGAGPRMLN